MRVIMGIKVLDREKTAEDIQKTLTEHGCKIRTRLGLHDIKQGVCPPEGLMLLELLCEEEECKALADDLNKIEGVTVKTMSF